MGEQSEEYKLGLALGRFVKEQGQRHPTVAAVMADLSAICCRRLARLQRDKAFQPVGCARSGLVDPAYRSEQIDLSARYPLNLEEVLNGFLDYQSIDPSSSPPLNGVKAELLANQCKFG